MALDVVVIVLFFGTLITLLRIIYGSFNAEFAYTALIGLLGNAAGIFLALVITPYSAEEKGSWSNLSSAVLGGVGYGIKVLDDSTFRCHFGHADCIRVTRR